MADDGNRKLWGAIAWGLGLLGLILVLVTDKKSDKELKYYGVHAVLYAIGFGIVWFALGIAGTVLSIIPYIGFVGNLLILLVSFVLFPVYGLVWLYGLWKAYSLEHFKLPVIGNLAEQFSAKL